MLANPDRGLASMVAPHLLQEMRLYIWPLYVAVFHPQRHGAVLAPIVVLGVWIYFFALILVLGAEVVAFGALADAREASLSLGLTPVGGGAGSSSVPDEENS